MTAFATLQGPLLFAHRGAPLERPENSLEAFAAALAAGADVLEIDVHMTRDGHVMVAHDADGTRMAAVAREVRACSLAEIERWDIGAGPGLRCPRCSPVRMPTLAAVLAELPRAVLNIDIKQSAPDMVPAVLAVVAEHRAAERVLLTSFSSAITARIHALGYRGPIGLGRAEAVRAVFMPGPLLARFPLRGRRLQVPLSAGPIRLDRRALIDKMHAHGLAVDYWVVNDLADAERLLALGADGIVTDDPRALASLYARSPHTAAWRARQNRSA